MTSEISKNRNRLITGLVILLVFFLLICYFLISFLFRKPEQPKLGNHSPVDTLAYCVAEPRGLCIVSFSQVVDGAMQINIQLPYDHYPEFVVIINRNGQDSTYECKPVENSVTGVVCTGASQIPGEILNFKIFSKEMETLLAEGNFAIIGIALFTPGPTSTGTLPVTETVTPEGTPPSYPNPTSYP
jgi:hypothetical protein